MGDVFRLLVAEVCREVLVLQRGVAEPEVLLREDEAPKRESFISPRYCQ